MKGQTLGEVYPRGTCFLCRQPCDPQAILHVDCARAYTEEKSKRMREREK